MLRPGEEEPAFSPGPWLRGGLYTLFALAALMYGHTSGERPLTPLKWAVLGAIAVIAGVVIAVLQNWARGAVRTDDPNLR